MSRPNRTVVSSPISRGQDAIIARIRSSSPASSGRGKLNRTMCCSVTMHPSEELEVLAHLPVGDLLALWRRVIGLCRRIPGQLGPFHHQQVVDESFSERLTIKLVLVKYADRFLE